MKKKHALTLLEVMISMTLLAILLPCLFGIFKEGIKKNLEAKSIKASTLKLELFGQRMKAHLLQQEGVWIDKHPDSSSPALFVKFKQKVDPDVKMCGDMLSMLYLNKKKELCFVTWAKDTDEARMEIWLDQVNSLSCKLFDSKKGIWLEQWPQKKEEKPCMVQIELNWNKKKMPFVFFLSDPNEKIVYKKSP